MHTIEVKDEAALQDVARQIITLFPNDTIFAFFGEMGAGKTTLIKALCQHLGSVDEASSPTYALVNEYLTEDGAAIYHFDFYRIEAEEEAYDIGFEDYLDSGNRCFIEWPEKIHNLLPENYVSISILIETGSRIINLVRC